MRDDGAMPNVKLPPELESFAAECVAAGRYAGLGDVISAALRLMRDREAWCMAFEQLLDEAKREAEAVGYADWEDVEAELDAIIAAAEVERAGRAPA